MRKMLPLVTLLGLLAARSGEVCGSDFIFRDAGLERGLGPVVFAPGVGSGVAVADYDDDGDADLFVPQASGVPDRLYQNQGNGHFVEVAASVGLASTHSSRTALWLDSNADGRLDLFVANDDPFASTSFHLYEQHSDGFQDVTARAGVSKEPIVIDVEHHRAGVCAGDIDNDGFLDIFTGQWSGPAHLFLNRGDGTFRDISASSGVALDGYMHQPVMVDLNSDGWLDIYATIDFSPNRLWLNQQDLTFKDAALETGSGNAMNDMGVAIGDYDNDGDFDIYITNIFIEALSRHNVLLRNDSTAERVVFRDLSALLAVDQGYFGWGTTFADFDNDGDLDIAATNGWNGTEPQRYPPDPSRLFLNPGQPVTPFEDQSAATGFDDTQYGSCLVAFDAERDGDLDLLQVTLDDGSLRFLENVSSSKSHWLIVRPRTNGSNRYAIGAVVRARVGNSRQMRLITAGTSYLGQEPAEAHFGLGESPRIDSLTVNFPDGRRVELHDVAADQVLTVRPEDATPAFTRGDTNDDGTIDSSDGVRIVHFLFLDASAPSCLDACDTNDDGRLNLTDGVHLLNQLFGRPPGAARSFGKPCNTDGSPDPLSCRSYRSCP